MRTLLLVVFVCFVASSAMGQNVSVSESWEGEQTVLGTYGTGEPPINAAIRSDLAIGAINGTQVLELEDNSPSGTPQAYVAWIKNLMPGAMVSVSLWRYDDTPDASPSCRLWGHWNDNLTDINGYSGSAGGNDDYGQGQGWDYVTHLWTNPLGDDAHLSLVVEIRTYSDPGDTVWIDGMEVTGPVGVTIVTPNANTPVDAGTWSHLKALYR